MIAMMAAMTEAGRRLGGEGVEGDLLELLLRAGTGWVLWLLLILSVLAIALGIERLIFYVQEQRPALALDKALAAVKAGDPTGARSHLSAARSMHAAIVRTFLDHAPAGAAAVEEHLQATIEVERSRYERGLAFLGTLGNNAPFIGLFGTVLGIIRAVHDLAGDMDAGGQAVMDGIAESLVATAVGLGVALPAVAIYNACARHTERATSSAEGLGHTLLGYLKREDGGT